MRMRLAPEGRAWLVVSGRSPSLQNASMSLCSSAGGCTLLKSVNFITAIVPASLATISHPRFPPRNSVISPVRERCVVPTAKRAVSRPGVSARAHCS